MTTKEFITHEKGSEEAWICLCGNRTDADGFHPCDKNGDEMVPAKDGRICMCAVGAGGSSTQYSLEVVGHNPNFKRLD